MENIQPNGTPIDGQPNNNTPVSKEEFEKLSGEISSLKSLFEKAMEDDEPQPVNQTPEPTSITDIWEKFDREPPKSYKDIRDAVKKEMEEELRQQEQQKEQVQSQQQRQRDDLNKRWDRELSELERAGNIPPVKNKFDKNDEGLKARTELFTLAGELGSADLIAVYNKAYVPSKASKRPSGSKAPVGGSSGAPASANIPSRDYRSLKMPIDDIKRKYFPEME